MSGSALRRRVELPLLGLCLAGWVVALLYGARWLPVGDGFHLPLYSLFALAAALGWGSGFVFAWRRRDLERPLRVRLFLVWFLLPPGLLFGLRALAPLVEQNAAPLVPLWSFAVFAVFFAVPATLIRRRARP